MSDDQSLVDHSAYERVLAGAMVDVATELRLADPLEFMMMIRGNHEANIADLVNSSSELFFKVGSLRYGFASQCELRWEGMPIVRLDMEFHYGAVTVFFRLTIERAHAGVEVLDVMFDDEDEVDPALLSLRIASAVAKARLR